MPEVPYKKTTLTRDEARGHVSRCFAELFGRNPEPQELALLLAQSEHETEAWQRMPNFNWAGIKAFKSWQSAGKDFRVLMTTEGKGADAKRVPQPFRAYNSAAEGCKDWLSVLARLWPTAIAVARSGDATRFVAALKHDGVKGAYFTGDTLVYTKSVEALATKWRMSLMGHEEPAINPEASPKPLPAPLPKLYATVPGYHRAQQAEVTPEMIEAAKLALKELQLGEIRYRPGYALACETHSNAPKGISVFLPDVPFFPRKDG